jgi:hypothetical protein
LWPKRAATVLYGLLDVGVGTRLIQRKRSPRFGVVEEFERLRNHQGDTSRRSLASIDDERDGVFVLGLRQAGSGEVLDKHVGGLKASPEQGNSPWIAGSGKGREFANLVPGSLYRFTPGRKIARFGPGDEVG